MKKTFLFAIVLLSLPGVALATPGIMKRFVKQYPESAGSQLASCRTCHMPVGQDFLNNYATALKENGLNFKVIEESDADGDGQTNRQEIEKQQLPGSQAQADEVFIFNARIGKVTFNHERHSLDAAYGINGDCSVCHGDDTFPRRFDDTIPWQNIAHVVCKNCHKKEENVKAPRQCRECHVKN
jgi:hypothetical protein